MIILDIEKKRNSDRSLLLVICAVAKFTRAIKMLMRYSRYRKCEISSKNGMRFNTSVGAQQVFKHREIII